MTSRALIFGGSGINGTALAETLIAQGWQVYSLSRGRTPGPEGCQAIQVDLTDAEAVKQALKDISVDSVFFSIWARQANEKENIRVNAVMVRNVFDAPGDRLQGGHAALITGLKHYPDMTDAHLLADQLL